MEFLEKNVMLFTVFFPSEMLWLDCDQASRNDLMRASRVVVFRPNIYISTAKTVFLTEFTYDWEVRMRWKGYKLILANKAKNGECQRTNLCSIVLCKNYPKEFLRLAMYPSLFWKMEWWWPKWAHLCSASHIPFNILRKVILINHNSSPYLT